MVEREVPQAVHAPAALFYHIAHLQIRNHVLDAQAA